MAAASHTEAMDESDDDYNFDTDFSWEWHRRPGNNAQQSFTWTHDWGREAPDDSKCLQMSPKCYLELVI